MSPLEIDVKRLLAKCESMVGENHGWRLEKYVEALDGKMRELRQLNVCQPNHDDLLNYAKKVKFLKEVIETFKLTSSSPSEDDISCETVTYMHLPHHHSNDGDSNSLMANKSRDIHLQAQAKYSNQVRKELFNLRGNKNELENGEDGTRRRNVAQTETENTDVDALLKYQQNVQEKVAEEMVVLAQNLKQNCYVSNQIINKDTEVLEHAGGLANANYENLRQNSDVISDFVRRSCQYWLWIMLALVSITFLWIVVFIRMFPKTRV